jgi:hypothetical protein
MHCSPFYQPQFSNVCGVWRICAGIYQTSPEQWTHINALFQCQSSHWMDWVVLNRGLHLRARHFSLSVLAVSIQAACASLDDTNIVGYE